MPHRYGSSASARVAIPLGAALVAAILLPALLLQTRDSGILPIAAPAASDSRIVHTQTQPKPAPKQHATARHAGHAPGRSAPAGGHRAAPHAKHAKADAKRAKAAKHAKGHAKHVKAKHRAAPHAHKQHAKHHGKGKS